MVECSVTPGVYSPSESDDHGLLGLVTASEEGFLTMHSIPGSSAGKPELHNVALQGRATQSSLSMWAGFKGSCTQTAEESSPWSRMDLHHNYVVYAIHAGSSSATVPSIPAGQTEYFKCKKIVKGRYVTVLPGNGTLSFCEVEVSVLATCNNIQDLG
uniref:Fucolectin tachylectin-4 pentraxin-1 domain-containing protein n=1 Tax=Electrophorus electricus TaxID=8005 RepID=A0AAY5EFQ0_ELEEL